MAWMILLLVVGALVALFALGALSFSLVCRECGHEPPNFWSAVEHTAQHRKNK